MLEAGPVIAKVAGELVKELNPKAELNLENTTLKVQEAKEGERHSRAIVHRFKLTGEYRVNEDEAVEVVNTKQKHQRKTKWWQCWCCLKK